MKVTVSAFDSCNVLTRVALEVVGEALGKISFDLAVEEVYRLAERVRPG